MTKEIKTITEWLGEQKLLEKRIKKTYENLSMRKMYTATNVESETLYKNELFENEETVKSEFTSLQQLIKNRDTIRAAIMAFNATNTIRVNDKDYIIAIALEKIKRNEIVDIEGLLSKQLYNKKRDMETYKQVRESRENELRETFSKKANSSNTKDNEAIQEILGKYNVIENDFLNISEKLDIIQQEKIEFFEKVNIQLNIKNSTTNLEIEL